MTTKNFQGPVAWWNAIGMNDPEYKQPRYVDSHGSLYQFATRDDDETPSASISTEA